MNEAPAGGLFWCLGRAIARASQGHDRSAGRTGMLLGLWGASDAYSTTKQAVLGAAKQTEAESV